MAVVAAALGPSRGCEEQCDRRRSQADGIEPSVIGCGFGGSAGLRVICLSACPSSAMVARNPKKRGQAPMA